MRVATKSRGLQTDSPFPSAFEFPKTLWIGKQFTNCKSIFQYLEDEADDRRLEDCDNLYRMSQTATQVQLHCKICSSRLTFKKENEHIVTAVIRNEHEHTTELLEKAKEKQERRSRQSRSCRARWKEKVERTREGTYLKEPLQVNAFRKPNTQ